LRLFYDFSGRKATRPKGTYSNKPQGNIPTSRKATMPQGDKATKHPTPDNLISICYGTALHICFNRMSSLSHPWPDSKRFRFCLTDNSA